MIAPKDNPPTLREKIQECHDTCVQLEEITEKRIGEIKEPEAKQKQEGRLSDLKNLRMTFKVLLGERDEEFLEEGVITGFIRSQRELILFKADPDRVGKSGEVLADLKKREFYEKVQEYHTLCKEARDAEMEKSRQGSQLAGLRTTELNTYLTIFQATQEYIKEVGLDACSLEEIANMETGFNDARRRFLTLLADPEYTGRTGEVEAEWAKKRKS